MQDPSEDKSAIERLKKDLYAPNPKVESHSMPVLTTSTTSNVRTDWEHLTGDDLISPKSHKKAHPAFVALLLASFVFFVGAALFAAYVFTHGSNVVSAGNVSIALAGPSAVSAGEPLPVQVILANANQAYLDGVDLTISYPDGTRMASNTAQTLPREEFAIGTLAPNATIQKPLSAVFYGEEGTQLSFTIEVNYRVRGSSAVFSKKKQFDVLLSSSPVSLMIDASKSVTSGQEFKTVVTVVSNSTDTLKDLLLKVSYGFGFTSTGAVPLPTSGNDTWALGDLRPGERRVITLNGKLDGQDGDQRAFQFSVGSQDKSNPHVIETPLVTLVNTFVIDRPFVSLDLTLNGDGDGTVAVAASAGTNASLTWTNNLSTRLVDVEIHAKLSGPFERTSVNPRQGFYKSSENTIIWDKTNISSLATLNPGDHGVASFDFNTISPEALLALGQGQEIPVEVTLMGKQVSENNVPKDVFVTTTGHVKISSALSFAGKTLYSSGAFKNTGPIPPRADKPTTYTIVWTLTNTLNSVNNVAVSAVLPQNVTWLSVTGPSQESITYNSSTREVFWHTGTVVAGTGFRSVPRIVSFQVSIEPSLTQVGTTPILVGPASIIGTDAFSGADVRLDGVPQTTLMSTDPAYRNGDEVVKQ